MKTKISKKVQEIAIIAVLAAIEIVMAFTVLGYLSYGVIEITFLMIPVAVGANLYGVKAGTILGMIFGITSLLHPSASFLFQLSPVFCVILLLVPRTAMGALCGLISTALRKKSKHLAFLVSSVLAAVLNTVLYLGFFIVLFGFNNTIREAYGFDNIWTLVTMILTINAVIEAAVSLTVGSAVSEALDVAISHI